MLWKTVTVFFMQLWTKLSKEEQLENRKKKIEKSYLAVNGSFHSSASLSRFFKDRRSITGRKFLWTARQERAAPPFGRTSSKCPGPIRASKMWRCFLRRLWVSLAWNEIISRVTYECKASQHNLEARSWFWCAPNWATDNDLMSTLGTHRFKGTKPHF